MDVYSIINTIVSILLGGGWFIHYRANKRKAQGEAKQTEAQANKEAQEYYNTTLADVNRTLNEVRAERDNYKDERNELQAENREMRNKYIELEDKITQMELSYKRDMARLGRRIEVLSPFLCGVVGCLHRKKVDITNQEDQPSEKVEDGNN